MRKYSLEEVMTPGEAAKRYGVTTEQVKNRLKPSRVGQAKVDQFVERGFIRFSGSMWLITNDFMEYHFSKKRRDNNDL